MGTGAGRDAPAGGLPPGRIRPVGYAQLVEGMIEQLELHDLKDPLAYLQGYYRAVSDLPNHA